MATRFPHFRLRQPEYTGKNRCIPCTIVNIVIAALLTLIVGIISIIAGVVVGIVALVLIYLRGYLVPGTPSLTAKYLPERILDRFGKTQVSSPAPDVDVESMLLAADILEPCDNEDDLCLRDAVQAEWRSLIHDMRDTDRPKALFAAEFDADADDINEYSGYHYEASLDGTQIGEWESEGAFVADMAAMELLRDRINGFEDLEMTARSQVLAGLRIFIEQCPSCDTDLGEPEVYESACCGRDGHTLTQRCPGCHKRVLTLEIP